MSCLTCHKNELSKRINKLKIIGKQLGTVKAKCSLATDTKAKDIRRGMKYLNIKSQFSKEKDSILIFEKNEPSPNPDFIENL